MNHILKSPKFWEILFIVLAIICISPLLIDVLILTIIPLIVLAMIPSVMAFKQKKFVLILINLLILIGALVLYIYFW